MALEKGLVIKQYKNVFSLDFNLLELIETIANKNLSKMVIIILTSYVFDGISKKKELEDIFSEID